MERKGKGKREREKAKALAYSGRYRGTQARGRCEVGDRGDGSSEFHESFTATRKWDSEGKRRRKLGGVPKARKQKQSQSSHSTLVCHTAFPERLWEEKELLTRRNC